MRKNSYDLLPFRFKRENNHVLLTNDVGDYLFLDDAEFDAFVKRALSTKSEVFCNLKANFMAYESSLDSIVEALAIRYRTKKQFLDSFTSLHMVVLTERCNQNCLYCHASSIEESASHEHDMDFKTARRVVEYIFQSPSANIKIEFQGGEPLLNFEVLREIVEYAEELNTSACKNLEFVLCSNLLALSSDKLDFLKLKDVYISTSLDGPKEFHDSCRKLRNGKGSYDVVADRLRWVIGEIGISKVSALMTVTPYNLNQLNMVVDEYLEFGMQSIFLRMLNPFGNADANKEVLHYDVESFLKSYKETFRHILDINLTGKHFSESYATLLLQRILTPFSTGFVDLQSPAGVGISGVIYYTNGDVFVSDEARMLWRSTGDKRFCLGNVHTSTWQEIFGGPILREIVSQSCIEALPGCAWCVYQSYCGGDPVRNYAEHGSLTPRNNNSFCLKQQGLFAYLFNLLGDENDDINDVFWSWITRRTISEVRVG